MNPESDVYRAFESLTQDDEAIKRGEDRNWQYQTPRDKRTHLQGRGGRGGRGEDSYRRKIIAPREDDPFLNATFPPPKPILSPPADELLSTLLQKSETEEIQEDDVSSL